MADGWIRRWSYAKALKRSPFNATERHILRVISDYQNEKFRRLGWAARTTIAEDAGCNEKTVDRCLKAAKAAGWIDYWPKDPNNRRSASEFRLVIPSGVTLPPPSDEEDFEDDDEVMDSVTMERAIANPMNACGVGADRGIVTLSKGHCDPKLGTLCPELGSESPSKYCGSIERRNDGRVEKHTPAVAGEATASAAAVSVAKPDESIEVDAFATNDGIPGYAIDFCQKNQIDDVAGLWEAFEGYATRERYRFSGATWCKPAAAQLFGKFVRIGLAQAA
ncbi:hypothetical protein [Burkholderia ubonensis]|uniref:hypothetical protein n=1 Tax=Burkholderia ubonensis TaxID=101571 RepID=UPI0007561970|nr:hypothetical protein [Burkholderia ubonensis]KVO10259.1 hypothetical protein WJ73_21335 [Burkholderia ubonensis]